jgi:DNA mismatch repair protein MutL
MAAPGKLPPLRVLGQIARMYIAAEGPDGLYLVDQHAAHERVVYERFMARGAQPYAQGLISPQPVSVPAALAASMEAAMEGLAELGLVLEPFGPGTVLLRAVPDAMAGVGDPADVLRDVLDKWAEGDAPIEEAFEARLVRMVCKRASVKAGQSLTALEMQRLVEDLEACESPLTCPHGRPTLIVIGLARLGGLFGR